MSDDDDEFDGNGAPRIIYGGKGWVAIHRSIREHWLVGFGQPVKPYDDERGSFSRSEAFIDLIMECRWEPGFVNNGGIKMELKPGQLVGAVSWLAQRWNWSPKTVRTFLEKAEDDGMLTVETSLENGKQKGKQSGVVTISNYCEYQMPIWPEGQAAGQTEGKQGASKGQAKGNNIRNTLKHLNTEKNPPTPSRGVTARKVICTHAWQRPRPVPTQSRLDG